MNKIEEVVLIGAGAQLSGLQGLAAGLQNLALSINILPSLRILDFRVVGTDGYADQLISDYFPPLITGLPTGLEKFVFECETPLMAVDAPLKTI